MSKIFGNVELIHPMDALEFVDGTGFLFKLHHLCGKQACMGWNYTLDFSWSYLQFEKWLEDWWEDGSTDEWKDITILDIGVGPGILHHYLECKYDINIVGVDRENPWKGPARVDVVGDFCDKETQDKTLKGNKADFIMAISAFEHNDYNAHKAVVDACIGCLAPGGRLISTVSVGRMSEHTDNQWNLTLEELREIYRMADEYETPPDVYFDYIYRQWRKQSTLMSLYQNRYKKLDETSPHFIVAGAVVEKEE